MAEIEIQKIGTEHLLVPIRGISPLILHNFGEKQRRKMLDDMQNKKSAKQPKDPQAEYEAAFHRVKGGQPGFPATGFKACTVAGARFYGSSVTMTSLRQSMFFRGEPSETMPVQALVRIVGEPQQREDVVRVARGGTDLRYRPEFLEWSAVLEIVYVQSMLTRDSLLSLIEAGGLGCGVGEWRPEKGGDNGQFEVDTTKGVEVVSD
jgi:hypothetical protein